MLGLSRHLACARCRLTVAGSRPSASSFLRSSIWARGWCFEGSCSSATKAVARASVTTHSSWPVTPFLGIGVPHIVVAALTLARSGFRCHDVVRGSRPERLQAGDPDLVPVLRQYELAGS